MPRRTRKRLVGKHGENNDRRAREKECQQLEAALHQEWVQCQRERPVEDEQLGSESNAQVDEPGR